MGKRSKISGEWSQGVLLQLHSDRIGQSDLSSNQTRTEQQSDEPDGFPTSISRRPEVPKGFSGPWCLCCGGAVVSRAYSASILVKSIHGPSHCQHGPYCARCALRMQQALLPLCFGCTALIDCFREAAVSCESGQETQVEKSPAVTTSPAAANVDLPVFVDPDVHYVTGDATKTGYGNGQKIIAHVVNTRGMWSKGFVMELSKEFGDEPRRRYFEWHRDRAETGFRLGLVQFVQVNSRIMIANMVGQCGTKVGSQGPPVRYSALEEALQSVGEKAREAGASVHMPRIACGLAGGNWEKVGPL